MRTLENSTTQRRPELDRKTNRKHQPLNFSLQQLEDRATAKTEVLRGILGQESQMGWHHWGLNE